MDKEEYRKHCEKQIKMCNMIGDFRHASEHELSLSLLNECENMKQEKEELKQVLIDIREYCKDDSEYWGNDSYIDGKNEGFKEAQQGILQIIDKVLDLDKVRGE